MLSICLLRQGGVRDFLLGEPAAHPFDGAQGKVSPNPLLACLRLTPLFLLFFFLFLFLFFLSA